MTKVFIGDVGVQITLETGQVLGDATLAEIRVEKPDGTEVVWPALVFQGSATTIYYLTTATEEGDPPVVTPDLDQVGDYKLQSYIEWGSGSKHLGETVILRVYDKYSTNIHILD